VTVELAIDDMTAIMADGGACTADAVKPKVTGAPTSAVPSSKAADSVLVGMLVVSLVVQGINVVEVYLVRGVLHASPAQFGLTGIFAAIGTFVASFLVARLLDDRQRVWGITIGLGGCGLACAAIGAAGNLWIYFALLAVLGFANSVANGAMGPLFLLRTPDAQRGQVMAMLNGLLSAVAVIALLIGGLVGVWLGPRMTFVVAGALVVPTCLIMGAFAIPAVRALRARTGDYRPAFTIAR